MCESSTKEYLNELQKELTGLSSFCWKLQAGQGVGWSAELEKALHPVSHIQKVVSGTFPGPCPGLAAIVGKWLTLTPILTVVKAELGNSCSENPQCTNSERNPQILPSLLLPQGESLTIVTFTRE